MLGTKGLMACEQFFSFPTMKREGKDRHLLSLVCSRFLSLAFHIPFQSPGFSSFAPEVGSCSGFLYSQDLLAVGIASVFKV
jgi:hypothetical protein